MYENLEYDPTIPGLLIEKYPNLAVYPEFTEAGDLGGKVLDRIIRYIILYCDHDSPFFKERDLDERHRKCVEAAKVDLTAENAIKSGHPIYKRALLRWFKLGVNGYVFENWISLKLDFHESSSYLSASLATASDPEAMVRQKTLIKKGRDEDMKALLDLEKQLFADPKVQKLVTQAANENSLIGWPEKMAEDYTPPD